jgi:hypothetical protein
MKNSVADMSGDGQQNDHARRSVADPTAARRRRELSPGRLIQITLNNIIERFWTLGIRCN